MSDGLLVELDDPWHPSGYRMRVPWTDDLPTALVTVAIGDVTEIPDPATKRRPSDRTTGKYVQAGFAADGVPVYRWYPAGPPESGT